MMDPITIALGVAKLAPMVAGWFGGDDAEDKAQKVVDVAEAVTGKKGMDVIPALEADPAMLDKFNAQVLEEMHIYAKDRANARNRDIEVRKLSGNNWRADILAVMSIVGLIGLIWTLLFVAIPDGPARDILLVLSGALVAIVKDVYQFEFGSSRGSKEKTFHLSQK
jgi:hypothetical protein